MTRCDTIYSTTQSLSKIQPWELATGHLGGFSDMQQNPKGRCDSEVTDPEPGWKLVLERSACELNGLPLPCFECLVMVSRME